MSALEALLGASLISVLSVLVFPRYDSLIVWLLGSVLVLVAGTRTGGFDFEEYEVIIKAVQTIDVQDWEAALYLAKDPLFLIIIRAGQLFNDDTLWVFLVVALISVATKVLASAVIPGQRTLFVTIYSLLIATGFEFAAIRAGMGIGFIMLALITLTWRRWLWALFAVFSHLSMLAPWFGNLISSSRWFVSLAVPIFSILIYVYWGEIKQSKTYDAYQDNQGTYFAFAIPIVTAVGYSGLLYIKSISCNTNPIVNKKAMNSTFICVLLSFLFALPIVSASLRILEISWTLMIIQWLALRPKRLSHALPWFVTGVVLISVLLFSNLYRGLWTTMLDTQNVW